jgi:hypothetical protein
LKITLFNTEIIELSMGHVHPFLPEEGKGQLHTFPELHDGKFETGNPRISGSVVKTIWFRVKIFPRKPSH